MLSQQKVFEPAGNKTSSRRLKNTLLTTHCQRTLLGASTAQAFARIARADIPIAIGTLTDFAATTGLRLCRACQSATGLGADLQRRRLAATIAAITAIATA